MTMEHTLQEDDAFWDLPVTDPPKGEPYIFVQWKGTNVCADFHCACGVAFHIDAWFMYSVKCTACGQHYKVQDRLFIAPCEPRDNSVEGVNHDDC